ncbi:MAG: hypothetical protein JO202_03310 [Ktedonobacteraceae bacterium]|nr:hypothetical protein [Ktedonobacteraceae bacterium]
MANVLAGLREPELLADDIAVATALPRADNWGWLPALSVTSALGLLLLALAYNAGRFASQVSEPLYWFGLLVLFLPVAWRLFSPDAARRERIALVIMLGMALYFGKLLGYPLYFAHFDELLHLQATTDMLANGHLYDDFLHVRTANDIMASGHLFQANPGLPISPFYPGLEIATNALSSLTGLSAFAAGSVLIGVARLVLMLALYLFYEHVSNSAQVAGISTLLYVACVGWFNGGFSYESLALPLTVLVAFAIALRCAVGGHRGLTLMICLGIGAVVITHHITSYILTPFLFVWMVTSFPQSCHQKGHVGPGGAALLALGLCAVWLQYTGDMAVGYLSPHVDSTVHQVLQILAGEEATRQLFHDGAGFVTPLWERVTGFASVALILLGLPFGLFHIWRKYRTSAVALALASGALAYPVSQAFRLTPAGAESADRLAAFLFFGVAFVLTIGTKQFWLSHGLSWRQAAVVMGAIGIIVVGQAIVSDGPSWARMPGPYLISADQRSIEPQGVTAAEWARSYLGPGRRVATDRINTLLMMTYGNEWTVTALDAKTDVAQIFISLQFGPDVESILQEDKIQYLVVDRRLSEGLPRVGTYFSVDASNTLQSQPISPLALAKFDNVKNVSRLFDSGDIIIYDVEAIAGKS